MEFWGHQKAFAFLLGTGMIIKAFVSDRHLAITKWMREECPKKCKELRKPVIKGIIGIPIKILLLPVLPLGDRNM